MKNLIKTSVVAALMVASAQASAQSLTYAFNYLAQANNGTGLSLGASLSSLGLNNAGSITFTDLSDLNLGDGKTGVRISLTLNDLSQFSSGTGSIYSNSVEFTFPGTGHPTTGGQEWIESVDSLRQIGSNYEFTTGGDGGIEWAEAGSVGNTDTITGVNSKWGSFQQQVNFVVGSFTPGETITWDFLNGGTLTGGPNNGGVFNGFSVSNLQSVLNKNSSLPSTTAWLRVRSIDGGIGSGTFSEYMQSSTNANTGVTTQTLQFLAIGVATAVPEADTYAMMMAGLGLMGAIVRRRKSA